MGEFLLPLGRVSPIREEKHCCRLKACAPFAAILMWLLCYPCWAQDRASAAHLTIRPEWEREALQHLLHYTEDGNLQPIEPFRLYGGKGLRCLRLNNYWCLKQRLGGWPQTTGSDADGHAQFVHAADGAAAAVNLLRDYYFTRNLRTLTLIVCRYAPQQDCIGSDTAKIENGMCKVGRNDCTTYVNLLSERLGIQPDTDLALFDEQGQPTSLLVLLLQQISSYELTEYSRKLILLPRSELIEAGIEIEQRYPR